MKRVPTVAELYAMGRHLAYPASYTAKGEPSTWHITPAGHAVMGDAMRENALEAIASGAADWVQPPSQPLPSVAKLVEGIETPGIAPGQRKEQA